MEWVDCYNCGGKGFFDDLHEVDPLWYEPDDTEVCDVCKGKGGWLSEPDAGGKQANG